MNTKHETTPPEQNPTPLRHSPAVDGVTEDFSENVTGNTLKPLGRVMMNDLGQIGVFDVRGEQVPELQKPLILEWAERAEQNGYLVDGLRIDCVSTGRRIVLIKQEDGFNFRVM